MEKEGRTVVSGDHVGAGPDLLPVRCLAGFPSDPCRGNPRPPSMRCIGIFEGRIPQKEGTAFGKKQSLICPDSIEGNFTR